MKLEEIARSIPALPVLRVEGQFVMDGDKNVAFVMLEGEAGAQVAKFFAGADAAMHSLLFEIQKSNERIKELEKSNMEWRSIVDNEREAHTRTSMERDRLKIVYAEIQDAHRAALQAARPLAGTTPPVKDPHPVMDGNPPSHIPTTAPLPTEPSPNTIQSPHPACVHNPGVFPQPVATELKTSGPNEYTVIRAEKLDAVVETVRQLMKDGWQPVGGICAENTNALCGTMQVQTRFYQAITR